MFLFDNVLTAGTVLVRQQIESQNYQSSGGTLGWVIEADGDATFNNVVLHADLQSSNYVANTSGYKLTYATGSAELNNLIARGTVQSSNFVTNISGWRVTAAGAAEFNSMVSRGSLATGFSPNRRIEIEDNGVESHIEFYSGDVAETSPAKIQVGTNALFIDSPKFTGRVSEIVMASSASSTVGGSIHFLNGIPSPATPGTFTVDDFDVIFNDAFSVPSMRSLNATDATLRSLTSTAYGGFSSASITTEYPASGSGLVIVGARVYNSGAIGNRGVMSYEIRDTNIGGTIRVAGNDVRGLISDGPSQYQMTWAAVINGLPTSGPMFMRPLFRSNIVTNTANFDNITISWIPSL